MALKGFTARETVAAFTEALRLVDAGVGSDLQRFGVLDGLCVINYNLGRMESALAMASQAVEVADRQGDTTYPLVGYRLLGTVQLLLGLCRKALESLQRAEQYRDPVRDKSLSFRFGIDSGLLALCFKSLALLLLGGLDKAARAREQILSELPSHGHTMTVAHVMFFAAAYPAVIRRDFEACERHCAELVVYCVEKKLGAIQVFAAVTHAYARAMREPTRDNIEATRAAIDGYRRSGAHLFVSLYLSHLADVFLAANDLAGAEAVLQEALAFVEQSGERFWLADLHRVDGQIALKRPEPDLARAEACFLRAIEIACGQEARLLELRAANDLARLWRDICSPNDPRELLEPILAAIEGGDDTRDVRSARALLAEIA